jgi:chromosome segregation ATPase
VEASASQARAATAAAAAAAETELNALHVELDDARRVAQRIEAALAQRDEKVRRLTEELDVVRASVPSSSSTSSDSVAYRELLGEHEDLLVLLAAQETELEQLHAATHVVSADVVTS